VSSESDERPSAQWLGWAIDAYAPDEMARRVQTVGLAKANLDPLTTFALAVVAGAFVALGAAFSTVAMAETGAGYSTTRLLGGLAFSLALVLVIVGGAELFTSNSLLVMAWASRTIPLVRLLRNWGIVYVGNIVGVLATTVLLFATRHATFGEHAIAGQTILTAATKASRTFPEALAVGILGNALVCLAVWIAFSARSTIDKIVAIVPPVTALVAFEFDHIVANVYYLASGLFLVHWDSAAVAASGRAELAESVTLPAALSTIVPVTLGNVVGGGILVAAVYWFVYLRPGREVPG
jgi:formate transporter